MRTAVLAALTLLGIALPGFAQTNEAEARKLAEVLGDAPDKWRNGGKSDHVFSEVEGKPLMSAGPSSTILTRLTPITGDSEVTIRFRLAQAPKRVIWFWIAPGVQKPDDNGENSLKLALATPEGAFCRRCLCMLRWAILPRTKRLGGNQPISLLWSLRSLHFSLTSITKRQSISPRRESIRPEGTRQID